MDKKELEEIWSKARQEIRAALIKMADRVWNPPALVVVIQVDPPVETPPAKPKKRRVPAKKAARKK